MNRVGRTPLERHERRVGDHEAGVLARPRVEAEERREEREEAAQHEEQRHQQEVHRDYLKSQSIL